jgi:hypothetical protein
MSSIASGVIAGIAEPAGVYNLADDDLSSQNAVIEEAARLLGVAPPPLQSLEEAALSPMALAFYAENRRIAKRQGRSGCWVGSPPFRPTAKGSAPSAPRPARSSPALRPNLPSSDQR